MKMNDEIVLRVSGILFLLSEDFEKYSDIAIQKKLKECYKMLNQYEYEDIII